MHASDSGYSEFAQRLGARRRVPAVQADLVPHRRDGQAADRGRDGRAGLPRRADPQPGAADPVDRERRRLGAVPVQGLKGVYTKMPQAFPEDPIEAFKRCVYVAPFWEDRFTEIVNMVGIDRVIFGSDWPHPEGLKDPDHLRRRTHRLLRRGHRQDHGRQPDEAHEGFRAGQEAGLGLIVAPTAVRCSPTAVGYSSS